VTPRPRANISTFPPSFSNWRWPHINGLHDFKGQLIHSANWPEDFDYKGKAVAVIGNGSSGVQIIPAIQPDVTKLVHIVRTPTWVIPPRVQVFSMGPAAEILSKIDMDKQENFTPEQIEKFKSDPEFYRTFVKTIEKEVNNNFPIVSAENSSLPSLPFLSHPQMVPRYSFLLSLTQSNHRY